MDLLGGYSSNSDDHESDDNDNERKTKPSSNLTPSGSLSVRHGADFPTTMAPTTAAAKEEEAAAAASVIKTPKSVRNSKAKKRGKKLLKLSAVLPEHIWNQLSGASGIASSAALSSSGEADDDSDDDDNYHPGRKGKQQTPTVAAATAKNVLPTKASVTATDSGLLGLLQALPKSKSAAYSSAPSSILSDDDPAEPRPPRVAEEPQRVEQASPTASPPLASYSNSLGAAFMTSTVVTTKRNRTGPIASHVRDIHNPNSAKETAPSSQTRKDTANEAASAARPATSTPSLASAPSFTSSRQPLPRPSASRTSTLPPRPGAAAPATAYRPPSRNDVPPPPHSRPQSTSAAADAIAGTGGGVGRGRKQSRKRQMEALLRAGRLGEIQEDHRLEASSHVYVPADATGGGGGGASHGVRVVPTTSYDVGTGGTTAGTDITGRQKNKHQLNSLLASAASLEAHRVHNPHLGAGSGGAGAAGGAGSQRASAKRKYGW